MEEQPSASLEWVRFSKLLSRVDELTGEMRLVESRMRGESYVLAGNAFFSQMGIESWCQVYFVRGPFKYVVDTVSLYSFTPTLKYKTTNDDLDEKSKAKRLKLTSSQGKALDLLHNVLPEIFGSMGFNPLIPIPNLNTRENGLSRRWDCRS